MCDNEATPAERQHNVEKAREWLASLAPSLKLLEPDAYALKHYVETGHVFTRGCCSDSNPLRARRESTRGL